MKHLMKRALALLLVLAMNIGTLCEPVLAAEASAGGYQGNMITCREAYINPLYQDVLTEADLKPLAEAEAWAFEGETCTTISEAAAQLKAGLIARNETIIIKYTCDSSTDYNVLLDEIAAAAFVHTGNPVEGDYLKYQYGGWQGGLNGYVQGNMLVLTLTYTVTYYTTLAQENAMDTACSNVISSLNLSGKSDYEKVRAIYDYVCSNVVYDNANLNNDAYKLKYTAYAALINGTSVCQGYACLMYRLLLMANVDTRIISGTGNGGPHAWNILKLGQKYYDIDSTWDAPRKASGYAYQYFLRCDANFGDHQRKADFTTAEFNAAYPMSETDYVVHTHSWNLETTYRATCDRDGSKIYKCSVCGETKQEVIPAMGHAYGSVWKTDANNHWKQCTRCTAKKDLAAHSGGTATTTEKAKCAVCGTEYGEVLDPEEPEEPEEPAKDVSEIFTDVPKNAWYHDSVQYVYDRGIITGMTNTTFGPAVKLSRAQFAVMLYRMEGKLAVEYNDKFPDVTEGTWYTDAVMWASENGIVTGYLNGKFGPSDQITREQMALMMWRFAKYKGYDVSAAAELDGFVDAGKVSGFAEVAMKWAVAEAIITGKQNGIALEPQGKASRAECATIIMRFMNKYM